MGLIDSVAVPVLVKRHSLPGAWVDGVYVPDENGYSEFEVPAAVQPQDPREHMNAVDGQRTKASLSLYTETQLKPADDKLGLPADIVVYNSIDYEVKAVSYYEGFGLKAYNVIIVEKDAEPAALTNPYED